MYSFFSVERRENTTFEDAGEVVIGVSALRRLNFKVEGLYEDYDHEIPINLEDHITAIIAPNGMGKTICLKLIYSLFSGDWAYFSSVDFRSVLYEFSDGSKITIEPRYSQDVGSTDLFDDDESRPQVWGTFDSADLGDVVNFELDTKVDRRLRSIMERRHPYMIQMS